MTSEERAERVLMESIMRESTKQTKENLLTNGKAAKFGQRGCSAVLVGVRSVERSLEIRMQLI